MGNFKKFLQENEDLRQQIFDLLDEMSDEEVDEFGLYLYDEFFEYDQEADDSEDYGDEDDEDDGEDGEDEDFEIIGIDEVKAIITELGAEFYEYILDELLPDDSEEDDTSDAEEFHDVDPEEQVSEGVTRRMLTKNINRKKRKFMKKSKARLRREAPKRKREMRKTRAKRKRYYRANKAKIKSYQKSRSTMISKGKHKVKLRRKAG